MAIYIKGINGPFSGKVGNIIGSYRNNTDYIRAMPTKIANPRTPAQTEQRNKFAKAISLIKPLVPLIRQAKQQTKNKKATFNAAVSYTIKNVITGQHPNYQINQKALDAFIENITHIAPPSSAKDEYAKQKNEYVNRENEYVKPQNEYVNEKLETQIIRIIKQNTTAKIEQIVQITQKSKATVWRKLKELKENNQIQYIGPAKNGGYALTTHQTTSQQHTTK